MHPEIDSIAAMGGVVRRSAVQNPLCNIGKEPEDGQKCHIGGLECGRRLVESRVSFPDPPPDVARWAADEIDYFALVYRDRYGSRILTIPQARTVSEIFGDAESAEDFQRRVASLADLLSRIDTYDQLDEVQRRNEQGTRVGPLVALERLMERDHPEAVEAVRTLRRIPDARNAFPIHSRSEGLIRALKDLGVDFPASDWRLAWRQVLTAFVSSLQTIRVALQTAAATSDTNGSDESRPGS
jgi:hypothetical protein